MKFTGQAFFFLSIIFATVTPLVPAPRSSAQVFPEPPPFHVRDPNVRGSNWSELRQQVQNTFGFPDAQILPLPANVLSHDELALQIMRSDHDLRFLQLIDPRDHELVKVAMPIALRNDVSPGKPFAIFSVMWDQSHNPEVVPLGYAKVHNADGVLDMIQSGTTSHFHDFAPGKVMSRQQVFELLHTIPW